MAPTGVGRHSTERAYWGPHRQEPEPRRNRSDPSDRPQPRRHAQDTDPAHARLRLPRTCGCGLASSPGTSRTSSPPARTGCRRPPGMPPTAPWTCSAAQPRETGPRSRPSTPSISRRP